MSAHCNDCGADLVYGQGEDWQIMTCRACDLRVENQRLREALREIQSLLNSDYPEWRIAEAALRNDE